MYKKTAQYNILQGKSIFQLHVLIEFEFKKFEFKINSN